MTAMIAAPRYERAQERAAANAESSRLAGLNAAKEQMRPYQEYGAKGMERQERLFNDPSYLQETGGYKFVQEQGLKGTTASRSNTSIFSGETLKALTEYSAGLASQEYGKEWDRFQKQIDVGAGATSTVAEIEAGMGEASARRWDQRAAQVAGREGFHRQISGQWSGAFASASASSAMACWVAEELYGVDAEKTHTIRAYVKRHSNDATGLGDWCRTYIEKGVEWAERIRKDVYARAEALPVWEYLYAEARKENV